MEDPFGSSNLKLPNKFDDILGRLKLVFGVETDTDFARSMGFRQGAVSSAKQKQAIPPAWITEVALSKGISADWLLTGEGEMRRDGARFASVTQTRELMQGKMPESAAPVAPERPAKEDDTHSRPNIGDLLVKTAQVLESDTVYSRALVSNIEAFHHGVLTDQRVDHLERELNQALSSIQSQLAQLRDESKEIKAENKEIKIENERLHSEVARLSRLALATG